MKINTLLERIEKAEKRIQAKRNTIAKKEKWIASGKYDEYEVAWYRDDIKRLHSEIAETEAIIEKYEKQLAGEQEREKLFVTEVPAEMLAMQAELIARWDEYDINRRNKLKAAYQELGYSEFVKRYGYKAYQERFTTDGTIHETNEEDAKAFVIDLYIRIKDITGKVISWDEIYYNGGALNGCVTGEAGKVKVESILAGGYNIQRLHIRVLVHSIN